MSRAWTHVQGVTGSEHESMSALPTADLYYLLMDRKQWKLYAESMRVFWESMSD